MTVKTLHGAVPFQVQRFQDKEQVGVALDYFVLTKQCCMGYLSPRLQELRAYYSNRVSYEEVERLVERVTGSKQVSDQTIQQLVVKKAVEVGRTVDRAVTHTLETAAEDFPGIDASVDLYDREESEILILDDSMQVKQQKAERARSTHATSRRTEDPSDEEASPRHRVNTLVMMLEKPSGEFEYMMGVLDEQGRESVAVEEVAKSQIIQEYGASPTPLKFVAITDGAKDIRKRLVAIFGGLIPIILDWYHLQKKVRELMSMIARNKPERLRHLMVLLHALWQGQTEGCLPYLQTEVVARNEKKLEELTTYLTKHQHEIIDYGRRKEAGKSIGSGRMEKGCDQVIGSRQKKQGMSWSPGGSKSLGILKVVELNHRWNELWSLETLPLADDLINDTMLSVVNL